MRIFDFLHSPSDAPALEDVATGDTWSYRRLAETALDLAASLETERRELVFCFCRQDAASIIRYIAAVAAGHAVALLDDGLEASLKTDLINRFVPRFVLSPAEPDSIGAHRTAGSPNVHPELRVLLSTSGTTGSPKFVRLSGRNVDANAESIVEYLQIDANQRPIMSLPIHYSYGLSVLHSHLLAGATLVVSPHSVMRPEFWDDFAARGCTSFAGVPYAYTMLERTGFRERHLPTLQTMTQAGGRMSPELIVQYHEHLAERDAQLVVMYGQTEATARISYVPPVALPDKAGSIGVAIPGGKLSITDGAGSPVSQGTVGEVIYEGPNVMLGYASTPDQLACGDELNGRLRTGDLGFVDGDGFLVLTGRSKRIAKVFGLRVNLDEVEATLRTSGQVAVVSGEDQIVIFRVCRAQPGNDDARGPSNDDLRRSLSDAYKLNPRAFVVRDIDALPLLGSGKVDYQALGALADDS